MYNVKHYSIPEGKGYSEHVLDLACKIKRGEDVEKSKEELFCLTYSIMTKEIQKLTYIRPAEELVADLSVAFMKTLKYFNPDIPNASFINYYKLTFKHEAASNYYGDYAAQHTELRKTVDYFKKSIGSLEELSLFATQACSSDNNLDANDILPDTVNVEKDAMDSTFIEDVHKAIEEIFPKDRRKTERVKSIFTMYIDSVLNNTGLTMTKISELHGTKKAHASHTIKRYLPRLQEKLRIMGYDNF